jgi:hypothetical protein
MNLILKILLILFAVVAAVVLFFIGHAYYWFATKQRYFTIASNVNISTDWLETTPQPPLKATKQIQYLIISVEGYKRNLHRNFEDKSMQIKLPDGTEINPEVQIVDEYGKVYSLKPTLFTPGGMGFGGDFDSHSSFPQDRSYTKVKIRSDKSFKASKVTWGCMNQK